MSYTGSKKKGKVSWESFEAYRVTIFIPKKLYIARIPNVCGKWLILPEIYIVKF
jgi:hypothetical protein